VANRALHFCMVMRYGRIHQLLHSVTTYNLRAMEWIDAKEQKPASVDVVAVICRTSAAGDFLKLTAYWTGEAWFIIGHVVGTGIIAVTHWVALPENPTS
jgi:hypothetical protein